MGNNPTEGTQPSLLTEIGNTYAETRREARGVILQHRQTDACFLLKEYTFAAEGPFTAKLKALQAEVQAGPREYIVSVVRAEGKTFNNFCSTCFKIYALFEYPQVTLREEISARQRENKAFEEAELWSILQSCCNALGELRPLVSLNPMDIFINADGLLKAIHDDLIDDHYRAVLSPPTNYAPQKLKNFTRLDTDLNLRKEAVFSMGMTLLEAAQLAPVAPCYDYARGFINEQLLSEMLDALSDKYSAEFVEVLAGMLQTNPNRRASLMEVQKSLDVYWGEAESRTSKQESRVREPEASASKQEQRTERQQKMPSKPEQWSAKQSNRFVKPEEDPPKIQSTLCEKNSNKIAESSMRKEKKEKDLTLPDEISSYKLQKPSVEPLAESLTTPKNPPTLKENCLYTDPRLLQMIRKDLQDINRLKQSAFYETGKCSYYQQEPISLRQPGPDVHVQPRLSNSCQRLPYPQHMPQFKQLKTQENEKENGPSHESTHRGTMLKKKDQMVFTIETYENGRRYEGTTLQGRKHGQGKLIFEDGAYYEGDFQEDKMTGRGILYYGPDCPAYDGQWLNDQFHGNGTLYNECPVTLEGPFDFRDFNEVDDYWVKYQGEFVLDNKNGRGKLTLTNGEVLQGEFTDDFIEGEGRFTTISGEVITGLWNKNGLTSIISEQY